MLCAKHMPKGPRSQKRPADVVSNAVQVMRVAVGEVDDFGLTADGKSRAAVELGRRGGMARADSLSKARRAAIARKAAQLRWQKKA